MYAASVFRKQGISQAQIAELVGASQGQVSRIGILPLLEDLLMAWARDWLSSLVEVGYVSRNTCFMD